MKDFDEHDKKKYIDTEKAIIWFVSFVMVLLAALSTIMYYLIADMLR